MSELTYAESSAFPQNLPSFAREVKPLTREGLKIAKANRQRFAKACLACVGNECAMRIWPAGYEEREALCRNTYCLPKKSKTPRLCRGLQHALSLPVRHFRRGQSHIDGR